MPTQDEHKVLIKIANSSEGSHPYTTLFHARRRIRNGAARFDELGQLVLLRPVGVQAVLRAVRRRPAVSRVVQNGLHWKPQPAQSKAGAPGGVRTIFRQAEKQVTE
jgi:hypothetical protein